MAIPIKSSQLNHLLTTGRLPDGPGVPGLNQSQQAALAAWWQTARHKLQADADELKLTIEDIYRRLAEQQTVTGDSTVINNATVDPWYYQHPTIALLNNNHEVMEGSIEHIDVNLAKAYFNWALTGFAICT
jgi:hypothetical protein